jgi:Uma2 family endonuclease
MTTALIHPPQTAETVADVVEKLGGIPLERIRAWPPLGTATEEDVLRIEEKENRLFELVDGVLVEKAMGFRESLLAIALARYLGDFVSKQNLGLVVGADGMMRLNPGLVRIPDVAFVSWKRIPGGKVPDAPIPELSPDLAVEILSKGNTPAEMARKRREYFESGVSIVWEIDPETRSAEVFTALQNRVRVSEDQSLDGGNVLLGFSLPLKGLFSELDRTAKG